MIEEPTLEDLKTMLALYIEEGYKLETEVDELILALQTYTDLCRCVRVAIEERERSNERILYLCHTGKEYPLITLGFCCE